ncbi:MAG: DUF3987 domain-containing protein, partial [Deltaproteobacteria bacterium]|nr:DUF3987 domain-containing protein [Deltaproteobacteria bacterium]
MHGNFIMAPRSASPETAAAALVGQLPGEQQLTGLYAITNGLSPDAIAYYEVRAETGSAKEKVIRPMSLLEGGWVMGRSGAPVGWYVNEAFRDSRHDEAVYVVEGAKKAAELGERFGLPSISFGAATNAGLIDISPLQGRRVVIWPDNDEPGLEAARVLAGRLDGIASFVTTIDVQALNLPEKGDVIDWLALHPEATAACVQGLLKVTPAAIEDDSVSIVSAVSAGGIVEKLGWEVPVPLPDRLRSVPNLSPEALPEPIRSYATDIARRSGVPLEFAAIPLLTVLSSAAGARFEIQPKARDTDFVVVPNLWGVIIGSPGARKTPAVRPALSLLKELEKASAAAYADQERIWKRDCELLNIERKRIEGLLKSTKDSAKRDSLRTDYSLLVDPSKPPRTTYVVNDPTAEALGEILEQNPFGTLVYRDELFGLLGQLDQPERSEARSFYLEGWNGNGSHDLARIGRGRRHIPRVCISLLGCLTPSLLEKHFAGAKNGERNDGMLQRFQLAVYPDVADLESVDVAPDRRAEEACR